MKRAHRRLALVAAALGISMLWGCGDSPGPLPATSPPAGSGGGGGTGSGGGTLVWSDEFSGPAGSSPDPANWTFDVGSDWGNSQLEYDTSRPSNVYLDGAGHLAITARAEDYLGHSYTSGRISTRGRFETSGGRIEASMKLPSGSGLWPAFWMLGDNLSTVGWPACGELDVMEYRGQRPSVVQGSAHGPGYSGGGAINKVFTLSSGGFNDGFHVFTLIWQTNRLTYQVDGVTYQAITPSSLPPRTRWVFDHPFYILLDLAVGGTYVGDPDAGTQFPQTVLVDYVRVYRLP